MSPRYMPRNDAQLLVWTSNYGQQLAVHGSAVGLTPAGIKTQQSLCQELTAAVAAAEKAQAAYRSAAANAAAVKAQAVKNLTSAIAHIDTAPGCTDAIRAALRIVPPQPQVATPSDAKPSCRVSSLPGRVIVKWKKGRLDGVNVYSQRGNETQWTFLGRDSRSPFDDTRPLETPGTPESRRYRIVGVKNDQEVTLPSDVISITIAD